MTPEFANVRKLLQAPIETRPNVHEFQIKPEYVPPGQNVNIVLYDIVSEPYEEVALGLETHHVGPRRLFVTQANLFVRFRFADPLESHRNLKTGVPGNVRVGKLTG